MSLFSYGVYGAFVYGLQDRFSSIRRSTLVLATIGATLAKLGGQVSFGEDVLLDVWELVDFDSKKIRDYSYEIYVKNEKVAWYDPFEHPHIPELASTHPHHKHIPPDIKHNRIPAPGLSFERPNLPFLIEEVERNYLSQHKG